MIRKLRTFVMALLLVPVLISNANAFNTEGDTIVSTSRSGWCYANIGGQWYYYPC
ncbi:MAG TPA: hypothetical protein VN818_04755 [Gammaproteobacteria bacterium]|nr:hypothetical protein [Gammaproteobacteria bacterium]